MCDAIRVIKCKITNKYSNAEKYTVNYWRVCVLVARDMPPCNQAVVAGWCAWGARWGRVREILNTIISFEISFC